MASLNVTAEAGTGTIHVFERAGLGKAPFRFLGAEDKWHSVPGAPKKPGGSCDFCGTAIVTHCYIRGADGRKFKVGIDCVNKTGDAGLRRNVAAAVREANRVKVAARAEAVFEAATEAFPKVAAALAAKPHPRGFAGKTLLDYVNWMHDNAGRKGKLEAAKLILAELEAASG